MQIKNPKDFWAGLMFIGFGLAFVVIAAGTPDFINRMFGDKLIPGYQIGSAVRMGPAYFPIVLGVMGFWFLIYMPRWRQKVRRRVRELPGWRLRSS